MIYSAFHKEDSSVIKVNFLKATVYVFMVMFGAVWYGDLFFKYLKTSN